MLNSYKINYDTKKGDMSKEEIKKGKKVWYHSFAGAEYKPAFIVSDEVINVCGTYCAFINIFSGCVDIMFLSPRD